MHVYWTNMCDSHARVCVCLFACLLFFTFFLFCFAFIFGFVYWVFGVGRVERGLGAYLLMIDRLWPTPQGPSQLERAVTTQPGIVRTASCP